VFHTRPFTVCALTFLAFTIAASDAAAQWVWTPQTGRFIRQDRLPRETPELQVEHARSLMMDGQYRKALNETEKFEDFYGDTDWADDNQFLRGEIFMRQGNYMNAAQAFQQVRAGYPNSDLLEDVIDKQYEIGSLYFERGLEFQDDWWRFWKNRPFRRAIDVYNMVISNARFGERASEARYRIGRAHFVREEFADAALHYRTVIEEYGDSDWVDEASYDLAMSHFLRSFPPEYNQVPSMLTIESIEFFKARFPNDERVDELTEIQTEMVERIATQRLQTAQFYERRREFQAALISYEVVVEQFPNTEAAQEAQAWLDENSDGIKSRFKRTS